MVPLSSAGEGLERQVRAVGVLAARRPAGVPSSRVLGEDLRPPVLAHQGPVAPCGRVRARRTSRARPRCSRARPGRTRCRRSPGCSSAVRGTGRRHSSLPEPKADRPVRGDARIAHRQAEPAPRAGQYEVPVVGARGVRVGDHAGAALDHVAEVVGPEGLCRWRRRSCGACGRSRRSGGRACRRLHSAPASPVQPVRGPHGRARRSRRAPAAADGRFPDEVQVLGAPKP